jgi:hypothetical protein
MRLLVFILCSALVSSRISAAQALPLGAHRPWIELGLGGSRQDAYCDGCIQHTIGGPSVSLAVGTTFTDRFGAGLLLRKFVELSWDESHWANYVVGLAQYSIWPGLTLNGGLGYGAQHGDHPPYGDNGSGMVIGGGVALRLWPKTAASLTLNADWMKSVSGTVRTLGSPGSSYHPLLFTLGLGLNGTLGLGLNVAGSTARQ